MPGKDEIVAGIRLDGEKEFKNAVTGVNKSVTALKSKLSLVTAQYDGQQNSLEALTKKQEVLNKILEEQKKKVAATKSGLSNAKESYGNVEKGLRKLYIELEKASDKMEDLEKIYGSSSDEVKEQRKTVDELSAAVSRGEANYERAGNRVKDWKTKLNNAESQVIKSNTAVEKNAAYMREAELATDNCATSIDGFGKEIKKIEVKTNTLKDSFNANVLASAAVKGFEVLTDKAKEAAKYVVDVGSSFESAMSEVKAISGASGDQFSAMEEKAKELGSSTKFSASEVAEGFKYMSLAGWSTEEMLSGISGVLDLAAASGMELAASSDMVTDYLSAFGMQASESAKMADMMAYAQANSNTSAQQLGEAYANCAANLNAAGQDIGTVTSLLEAMANQGTKGSKAGTQLSAIMRDLTAKMKDGKVAIGDANVEVMDASGNYRDLTDILADVEAATDGMGTAEKNAALSATFTADSINGMNLILNEGMRKVSGYEKALKECDGAASAMAATMQDNLQGKMTEMDSALEGLGIAAYGYVSGPLQSAVEGVTDVINGITEAITPQKTELETYIEEVRTADSEIGSLLEKSKGAMSGADTQIGDLEAYRRIIEDLSGTEEKSEYQKYQLKNAVQALADTIPALSRNFDEEKGSINLSKEAIDNLFESQKKLIMQNASMEAQEDAYKALFDAELNAQKAADGVEAAQAAVNARMEENAEKSKLSAVNYNEFDKELIELNYDLQTAEKAQEDANKTLEDARKNMEQTKKAAGEIAEKYALEADAAADAGVALKENGEAHKENAKAAGEDSEATAAFGLSLSEVVRGSQTAEIGIRALTEETEEASETMAEAAKAGAEAQKTAFRSVSEAYRETVQSIEADLQSKINPFDKFDGGEDMTVEKMLENLKSQTEGMEEYQANMQKVTEAMGNEIAPEFLSYIESMGLDGANMLRHMAVTLEQDNGKELLKQMSDEYIKSLDMSEGIARASAANEVALQALNGELGSTEFEFEDLRGAVDAAVASAAEGWQNLPAETENALNEAVNTAQQCGAKIPDGLADGIISGETTPEEAIAQLNGSIQGSLDGLLEAAEKAGLSAAQDIAAGLENGSMDVQTAYKSLLELMLGQMDGQQAQAESAGSDIAQSGANAAKEKSSEFETAGHEAVAKYAAGILAKTQDAVSKTQEMARQALAGANSYQNAFYNAGYNMAAGVASGIRGGQSGAISAAQDMAVHALNAAKSALLIKSPSRRFREEVGAMIPAGMAFGIKDKTSLAGKAASRMSNKVYTSAVSWLAQYKKSQQISLEDEKYYWQEVLKHTKSGTTAYKKAMGQLNAVVGQQIGSRELAEGINTNFGVTKTKKSGKKTVKKDTESYYAEIYSAAQKLMKNYQVLNEVSTQQELAYWQGVQSRLKKGTQGWYDATAQIKNLQNEIVKEKEALAEAERQAQRDAITTRANVQEKALNQYKVYYKVSAKAEADYWNTARKQFKTGTDERIEADQKYFAALRELNEQRKDLDEDYAKHSKEVNDKLKDDIEELQGAYKDAVRSRKEDILSQMDLFEAWDSSGYDADTLLYNLKTQVAGLTLWEQQLEELGKKGLSSELMEELKQMGPDAAASIYSLNQMTAQQLTEYENLWKQKNTLAESQAVKDNEQLRQDSNKQITQLRLDAQSELNALNAEYRSAIAELYSGMTGDLAKLVNQAGSIGEDAVAGLIAGIGKAANSVDAYNSTTQVVSSLTEQLSVLEQEGSVIGKSTLDGLLEGMSDQQKINIASKNVIQSIKKAMEEEAEIHSPSRLFRRETGPQIPAGVALGMEDGTKKAAKSSQGMMREIFEIARAQMQRQQAALQAQAAGLNFSGIAKINDALGRYQAPQTVVNVDNAGVLAVMQGILTEMHGLVSEMKGLQVVMDSGAVVGEIHAAVDQANAADAIRRNRGRF